MLRCARRASSTAALLIALVAAPTPSTLADSAPPRLVKFCGKSWPLGTTEIACYAGRAASPRPEDALDLTPLAELSELRRLSLVSGEIEFILTLALPDARPLAALRDLEVLELGHTTLADITPLAALKRLKTLRLHASPVRDVRALAALTALEELDLSCTQVTDVAPLAALPHLARLDLTNAPVRDLRPLAPLTHLGWLGLAADADPAQREALKRALPSLKITEGRRY